MASGMGFGWALSAWGVAILSPISVLGMDLIQYRLRFRAELGMHLGVSVRLKT